MSGFVDPSWCARLHAARSPVPASTSEPAPVPQPARFFTPREIPRVHDCECCGSVMYDHNCKIVCPNCGYKRDCSDP